MVEKSGRCDCRCLCSWSRIERTGGLCENCWGEWARFSTEHGPIADGSYLATYGITGIWSGWIMAHAAEILAETPAALQEVERRPRCPSCEMSMVLRADGWKCYRHDELVVVPIVPRLPRSPALTVIGQ